MLLSTSLCNNKKIKNIKVFNLDFLITVFFYIIKFIISSTKYIATFIFAEANASDTFFTSDKRTCNFSYSRHWSIKVTNTFIYFISFFINYDILGKKEKEKRKKKLIIIMN